MSGPARGGGVSKAALDLVGSDAQAALAAVLGIPAIIAADGTVQAAAAAAVGTAAAGLNILVATTVEGGDFAIGFTDLNGNQSWVGMTVEGLLTEYAKTTITAAVAELVATTIGYTYIASADIAWAVTDAGGRQGDLAVGLDGRLTERSAIAVAARLAEVGGVIGGGGGGELTYADAFVAGVVGANLYVDDALTGSRVLISAGTAPTNPLVTTDGYVIWTDSGQTLAAPADGSGVPGPLRTDMTAASAWGTSYVGAAEAFPPHLATLLGAAVYNGGMSGSTSTEDAIAQGAVRPALTLDGNSIPASTSGGTGDLTNASNQVTNLSNASAFTVGKPIDSAIVGIPVGATVLAVNVGALSLTLSSPATVTSAGVTLYTAVAGIVTSPTTSFRTGAGIASTVYREFIGTLAGVTGTLMFDREHNMWRFRRAASGSVVACPAGTTFRGTDGDAYRDKWQVWWAGRNNFTREGGATFWPLITAADIVRDYQSMRDHLTPYLRRYAILLEFPAPDEIIGTGNYAAIQASNAAIRAEFPGHTIEIGDVMRTTGLAMAGLTPTAQDTADIAAGTVPRQLLQVDVFHPSATCQQYVVAPTINTFKNAKGW